MQSWIERALFDSQIVVRRLVNSLCDSVAMHRSRARQNFQDEKIQCALETVILVFSAHAEPAIYSCLCIITRFLMDGMHALANQRHRTVADLIARCLRKRK